MRTPTPNRPADERVLKNRLILGVLTCLASVGLAVFSSRSIGDDRLVALYFVAAGIHFIVAVHAAYILSGWERPTER